VRPARPRSTRLPCVRATVLVTALGACSGERRDHTTRRDARPTIALRHGTTDERQTQRQLERLSTTYDLAPWQFTRNVVVDADAVPHSHPVLTLHTRHLRDDLLLLSTYIHEQSHWFLAQHATDTAAAVADLRALVPSLPVGFPDGAQSLESSYEHLIVIALEVRGLRRCVGELSARQAMEFWATDHYRGLYRYVLEHERQIWDVVRAHRLAAGGDGA
jgi:hypothetical protein